MKFGKLIALTSLICCFVLQVEAHAGLEPSEEQVVTSDSKKPVKYFTQAVVRPDGRIVDRLTELNSVKPYVPLSLSKQHGVPATPEAWLARMLDPTKNGLVVKHPELFAEWLDAVTEPRFMTAIASIAMTPQTYTNTFGKFVDPAVAGNWAEFADPMIFLRWMQVGTDPGFYQAVFNRMTDSGKLRRWGISPVSSDKTTLEVHSGKDSTSRESVNGRSQEWLQLQMRDAKANPWLSNSVNYRY